MQMEEMEATSLLFYQFGGMPITGIVGLLVSNREKIRGRGGELTSVTRLLPLSSCITTIRSKQYQVK